MPEFRTGNMWSVWSRADLFFISTNSTVTRDGRLVMGRGIALEAKNRFPGLDFELGKRVLEICGSGREYYLLISPEWKDNPHKKLACFQVKRNWKDKADLILIGRAIEKLIIFGEYATKVRRIKIHMNFPGIGNGGLARDEVLPLVKYLPDYVTVWEKEF